MRWLLAAAVACSCFAACSAATAGQRPPWVSSGVKIAEAYFRGSPAPERVTWGTVRYGRWVMVVFRTSQVCATCHGPQGSIVTGRRIKITWYQRGVRRMSVSITKT